MKKFNSIDEPWSYYIAPPTPAIKIDKLHSIIGDVAYENGKKCLKLINNELIKNIACFNDTLKIIIDSGFTVDWVLYIFSNGNVCSSSPTYSTKHFDSVEEMIKNLQDVKIYTFAV